MFEQNDDKTVMTFIVQHCPVFYFTKEEDYYPLDVEQFLRKCQLKHVIAPYDVYCSSIQNLFLEKRYLIQGKTCSPLTDKEFYIQPSHKVSMLNHLSKSVIYTRLTVNAKYIRVSYMMFFKENEGAVHNNELIKQQHGDWKHVALYFDKATQDLTHVVLENHFGQNQVVSADTLEFETVAGHYRPVFYISQGTHSVYPVKGIHQCDTIHETTSNGKKWMPRNIIFLPETLQRARRTKSSWVYYRGQYGCDTAYGPVYLPWWNQDQEFMEHVGDAGMGEFKIRSERLDEISAVIDQTSERIRSRVRPQTEVNRSRLKQTATTIRTIQKLSSIQPTSLTKKAEVLLEKQNSIEQEEQAIQEMKKDLEIQLRKVQEQQQELRAKQDKLAHDQEALDKVQQLQTRDKESIVQREQELHKKETELSEMKQHVSKKIDEIVKCKQSFEQKQQELEELRTTVKTMEQREKELSMREAKLVQERQSITTMLREGMAKSQEDYSKKKKELREMEQTLHASEHALVEKSKEMQMFQKQLEQMTEQLEERQHDIHNQETAIEEQKRLFDEEYQAFQQEKTMFDQLKEDIHVQDKEATAIETQTKETQETMSRLTHEIKNLKEREARLTQRETVLETQITELQEEMNTIQQEAKTSLASLKQNYTDELEKVHISLQVRDKRIHHLEVLLESAKTQHNEHNTEKTTQDACIASLRETVETALQKENDMKTHIQTLEYQLQEQTQIVETIREELEKTERKLVSSVQQHTEEPDASKHVGAKVSRVLRERDQEIQVLRHYIDTVETKVQNAEKAKHDLTSELERIQAEFKELQTKYEDELQGGISTQNELNSNIKTQQELTSLLENVQEQVAGLSSELEEYKVKEKEWKKKYEGMRQQAETTQQTNRKLQQSLSLLSKDHDNIRKSIKSKQEELRTLTQTKTDLERKLYDAHSNALRHQDLHEQSIKALKEEYAQKESETESMIQTYQTRIEDQSKTLEHQRQRMEKQKAELTKRMETMIDKASLHDAQRQVVELEKTLTEVRKENQVHREKREKGEKEIQEQTQRLSHMEHQVREWKKQHASMEANARSIEQKYTRLLQEVEGYQGREQMLVAREQELDQEKQKWETTLRVHQEKIHALTHELEHEKKQSATKARQARAPSAPVNHGNLMFTQNRAPLLGRQRQVRRVRG